VHGKVPYRILFESAGAQSEYITGMSDEQKSDISQILWLDAAVILIIAVIAIVSNAHAHAGHVLHQGR
jgi:hypothetical protein